MFEPPTNPVVSARWALWCACPLLLAGRALAQGPVTGGIQAPPAEAAERPFAESVVVLAALDGEAAGEQFGWVARAVGDVDGDGAIDYASTAPFHGGGRGRVDVHSGRTGARLARFVGRPGELAGWVVAPAGDLDADGRADVALGAPGAVAANGAPGLVGRVYVLSGKDGAVLRELVGDEPADRFGEDVAPMPDLDGDGRGELAIGAPQHAGSAAEGGPASGAVFVCSGATGARLGVLHGVQGAKFGNSVACAASASLLAVTALDGGEGQRGEVHVFDLPSLTQRHVVAGVEGSVNLGWFLSLVPDLDGDGVHEVYATDWYHAGYGGRALVTSGRTGAALHDFRGERAGVGLGIGVAGRDDFDGDGVVDFVIGVWIDSTHGKQCGRIDVRSGQDGALLGRVTGRVPGAALGFDADSLGDVNGDGVPDLLVTAAYHAAHGDKTGRTYVLSGASVVGRSRR